MKFFFVILLCVFATTVVGQNADEAKLITTMKEFHQALVKQNAVFINQQTDKAVSYGHSNGWVQNKKDLIKDFERGFISYQSYKEDSITVTMNDNMANVRFIADISASVNGTEVHNYHLKVLEVWVKKSKSWVLFARQAVKR